MSLTKKNLLPTSPVTVLRDLEHVLREHSPKGRKGQVKGTNFDDGQLVAQWVVNFCIVFHALYSVIEKTAGRGQADFFLDEVRRTTTIGFELSDTPIGFAVLLIPYGKDGVFPPVFIGDESVSVDEIICLYRAIFRHIPLHKQVMDALGLSHVIYLPGKSGMRPLYYDVFTTAVDVQPFYYREDEYADLIEAPLTELHQHNPDAAFIPIAAVLADKVTAVGEQNLGGMQGAFNDALAVQRGFKNAAEMIAAMDEAFGPSPKDPQERFNLSFARTYGHDSVEKFLAETRKGK